MPALLYSTSIRPHCLDGAADHALDVVGAADVGLDEDRVAAGLVDRLDGLLAGRVREIDDGDLRAFPGEQLGRRPADAGAGARDQGDFAFEPHQSLPPFLRTTKLPSTSVSRPLAKNVFKALSGVVTIGSPRRLNEVFMMTGTPVSPSKLRDQAVVARVGVGVDGLEPAGARGG